MSINKAIRNPPCTGSGEVQDGGMLSSLYHKLGKEVGRAPCLVFTALSVDLGMHLPGISLLVSGPLLANPKFRAVLVVISIYSDRGRLYRWQTLVSP